MGRPQTELLTAKDTHHKIRSLIEAGIIPNPVPRSQWDAGLVTGYGIGITQAGRITRTGEAAGFWKRLRRYGSDGSIDVAPIPPTAIPLPLTPA